MPHRAEMDALATNGPPERRAFGVPVRYNLGSSVTKPETLELVQEAE
jgi:hypothetical protein